MADALDTRVPTVVVDDVHITYTVNGARTGKGSATSALNRIVSRGQPRGARQVHAVKGVSFAAYKGEAIGLIGSNGSGKSTLLKAIAGLLPVAGTGPHPGPALAARCERRPDERPDRGTERRARRSGHGHDPRADPRALPGHRRLLRHQREGDFITLPMRTYSSGMGARLRFSIAAAKSHDVLLIDEALSTGDAKFQRRSKDRIKELREEAGTVFLVSHSNRSITETCDRAIWLEAGTLRMDGPAKEVVAAYEEFTGPVKPGKAGKPKK